MKISKTNKIALVLVIIAIIFGACAKILKNNPTINRIKYECGGPDDGRFTVGANNIRLMYGFPIPASTSHFVVKVNDKFASNYKGLGSTVTYICTTKKFKTVGNKKFSEMEFSFENIKIKQRLVPVNDDLVEVDSLTPCRYYRIEYEFENNKAQAAEVGFQLLIDNMIGDNDAPKLDADGKKIGVETRFQGADVPKQVFLYRTENDLSDHTAEILTDKAAATKPDELAIGRWPYFHNIIWDYTPSGGTYGDAAVFLRWNAKSIPANGSKKVAVYYGMARKMNKQKKYVNEVVGMQSVFTEKENTNFLVDTVYFDNANATLSKEFIANLDKRLVGRDLQKVVGIIIEGHTDAKGTDDANVEYSRKRAKVVKDYLIKKGVAEFKIVPKGFGEMYAKQTEDSQKNGNAKDRNAVLMMYYKE